MSIRLINILRDYDRETKGTLATDLIELVYHDKIYTLQSFVKLLISQWIPIWKEERVEDLEVIQKLEIKLKNLKFN